LKLVIYIFIKYILLNIKPYSKNMKIIPFG
jgi:hypothetical protein